MGHQLLIQLVDIFSFVFVPDSGAVARWPSRVQGDELLFYLGLGCVLPIQ